MQGSCSHIGTPNGAVQMGYVALLSLTEYTNQNLGASGLYKLRPVSMNVLYKCLRIGLVRCGPWIIGIAKRSHTEL